PLQQPQHTAEPVLAQRRRTRGGDGVEALLDGLVRQPLEQGAPEDDMGGAPGDAAAKDAALTGDDAHGEPARKGGERPEDAEDSPLGHPQAFLRAGFAAGLAAGAAFGLLFAGGLAWPRLCLSASMRLMTLPRS